MKKKINIRFIKLGFFAVVASVLMSVFVCYGIFKEQMFKDLEGYASIMMESGMDLKKSIPDISKENIRITLIGVDGVVVAENMADAKNLDNHGDRPEVVEARENGVGYSTRVSGTLSKNSFYYAVLLDDGSVLRLSKDAISIYVVFGNAFPVLILMAFIIIVVCALLASYLTKSIVEPIENMAENFDTIKNSEIYEEMVPILEVIKESHNKTLSNARMRQEFTANVSHELKTPLTAISGYAELLESGMATGKDVARFSGEIRKNANRLLMLINDTIKLSELDDTASNEVLEELDLNEVVNANKDALRVNANKHGINIEFIGMECKVMANKDMLEEILWNLCDNAIRYNNENGSVTVTVSECAGRKILSVKDTGIGIPKEHQERIFERFYRVDKSRSKSTGGTGLGLAIVKHMVARQNAQVELDSEIGKGTEIKVVFH